VNRFAVATFVVTIAKVADADSPPPAKQAKPDEIADIEGREANLESKASRKGLTFALSPGLGIMIGGDTGVGRGPAISLRLGHVATRKTIITFELTSTSALHKPAMSSETLSDNNFALFAGAQRYTSASFWLRTAGGLAILVKNANANGTGGDKPILGAGGLVGGGLDLARFDFGRLGFFVLGFEGFGMASVSRDGFKAQLGFNLGFSLY
jgi:hypothetical protein